MSRNYFAFEEEHTKVFPNVTETEEFSNMLVAGKTFTVTGLVFHTYYTIVVLHHAWRGNNNTPRRIRKRRILLLNLICSVLCEIMLLIGLVTDMTWQTCCVLGRFPAFFYVTANYASYLVLLDRAVGVRNSILSSPFDAKLLSLVKLGTASVPLISLSCLLLFEGRVYFQGGACIQVLNSIISWIFTVLDSSLSIGYLLLFLSPVLRQVEVLKEFDGEAGMNPRLMQEKIALQRAARKNLYYSLATILSTFIHMVITSRGASLLEVNQSPSVAHLILTEYISGPLDLTINSRVNLTLMKSCWQVLATTKVNPSNAQKYSSK